jgi:hypothetical protein
MFLESPVAIVAFGIFVTLLLLAVARVVPLKSVAQPMMAIAAITVGLLFVEHFVQTDREVVSETLNQMAADLERNDLEAVLGHIHGSAPERREQAATAIPLFFFESIRIDRLHDVRIIGQGPSRKAIAEFNVTVVGRDREGTVDGSSVPRFVILTLQHDQGAWRVVDVEDHDAQRGFAGRLG